MEITIRIPRIRTLVQSWRLALLAVDAQPLNRKLSCKSKGQQEGIVSLEG